MHFYTCLQLIEAIIRPIALIKEFIALHCVQENFRHIYEMYLAYVHSTFGRFEKGEQVESVAQGLVGVAGEMSPAAKQRRHYKEMALYCNSIRMTSIKNGSTLETSFLGSMVTAVVVEERVTIRRSRREVDNILLH